MSKPIRVRLASARIFRRAATGCWLILAGWGLNAKAQTLTTLYSFNGSPDGKSPLGTLMQGSDGNFYGTTSRGGNTNIYFNGYGTVFQISSNGIFTNLYVFASSPNDGQNPEAGLLQASDGNFYGTANQGGTYGAGIMFRISSSGSYTNFYSFRGLSGPNYPEAGLVQGSDGSFYGTTYGGNGAVFRINPNGILTILHSFGLPKDGITPTAGVVQGSDGNFYGTTPYGGVGGGLGFGCIFRVSPTGSYTNPYVLGSSPYTDGANPFGGLVQGSDGNFYGTTEKGGGHGIGTVFQITPSGNYMNLYTFGSVPNDGYYPTAGLVQGSDGNFYGTTGHGGTSKSGTVFRISMSGNYTNLYSFGSSPGDGSIPYAGLIQASDGSFYGTTQYGGTSGNCYQGCGTVFKLTVPLDPPSYPINQITGIQLADTNVILNILSVAGETYQLQFSGSMQPTNWVNVDGVSVTNSIGAMLTLTNFGGAVGPQGFYRFDITP